MTTRGKHGLCDGVPVVGTLDDAAWVARDFGIGYAILAIPGIPRERLALHLRRWRRVFQRILIISESTGIATQWTEPRDLGGMTGFETHQKLLDPMAQLDQADHRCGCRIFRTGRRRASASRLRNRGA
jgi:hypothetical protein